MQTVPFIGKVDHLLLWALFLMIMGGLIRPVVAATPVKVVSYNVWQCRGTDTDGYKCNIPRQAQAIAASSPDVVLLEEVVLSHTDTYVRELTAATGGTRWLAHRVPICGTSSCANGVGQLLLSRLTDHTTTTATLYYSTVSPARRSAGAIVVDNLAGQKIAFIATHLSVVNYDSQTHVGAQRLRQTQMNELRSWASTLAPVQLIGGDFNFCQDWTLDGATEVSNMTRNGYGDSWAKGVANGTAQAYPPDNPSSLSARTRRCRLDYIFYSNSTSVSLQSAGIPDLRSRPLDPPVHPSIVFAPAKLGTPDDYGIRPSDHNLINAGFLIGAGTSVIPPAITSQPVNRTVATGQSASFSVTASGTAPMSYQWQSRSSSAGTFANVSGATAATYTTPATITADNGKEYRCIVTNSAGSATTNSATLTVTGSAVAPSITTQPTNRTVTAGQTTSFSIAASGTAPLGYQWQSRMASTDTFANITGATAATYTTGVTGLQHNGKQYRCIVTNSAGSATSNPATLTVTASAVAPSITTQPTNRTVTAGQTTSFSIAASGTAPLGYQWQSRMASTDTFANITGATAATYTTGVTGLQHNGKQYRCIVTNSAGTAISNTAIMTVISTVLTPPSITLQPVSRSVTSGQTAVFSITANGTAPLSYQWQSRMTLSESFVNIASATASSYTTGVTGLQHNGKQYRCVVSNSAGTITSNVATLTVTAATDSKTLESTLIPAELAAVRVYPNPWRNDQHNGNSGIVFDNFSRTTTVRIFSTSGHLVNKLPPSSTAVTWNLNNEAGDRVASGIYIFLMETDAGAKRRGKIVVIR